MLPEAFAIEAQPAAFEWKAGCSFLSSFIVSLLKKINYFKCRVNMF